MMNWICSMDMGCPIDRAIDYNRELLRQAQEAEADLAALRETARSLAVMLRQIEDVWCSWLEGGDSTTAMDALMAISDVFGNGEWGEAPAVRALLTEGGEA